MKPIIKTIIYMLMFVILLNMVKATIDVYTESNKWQRDKEQIIYLNLVNEYDIDNIKVEIRDTKDETIQKLSDSNIKKINEKLFTLNYFNVLDYGDYILFIEVNSKGEYKNGLYYFSSVSEFDKVGIMDKIEILIYGSNKTFGERWQDASYKMKSLIAKLQEVLR